jgi:fatty acid desaturase
MAATSPKLGAVIVAAILYWLLGALWFTLFKQQWLVGIGKTSEQLMDAGQPAWLPHVVTLIANLALAYVLGWAILATGPQNVIRGLQVAAVLWLGLIASAFATEYVFEARSVQIFAINAGYPLVGMLLMGIVLGAWKR